MSANNNSKLDDNKYDLTRKELTKEDLSNKIAELTEEEQQKLERLFLRKNKLQGLPQNITLLKNLRVLDLGSNQITELPVELAQLTKLQSLYLQDNKLTAIPKELSALTNIDTLWLENNAGLGERAKNVGKPFHEDLKGAQALLRGDK